VTKLEAVDRQTARRLITHLKAGTTPIDCVEYINVGNERWYSAAVQQFEEIQGDADSLVRFINGYYGDGKTHFMGMLRSMAFNKGWVVTYVTAESTPLHKFDIVYSELVKNLSLPPQMVLPEWLLEANPKGASALLAAVFARFYFEAYRLPDKGGLQKERVLEALRKKAADLAADAHLHESMGAAIRAYVEAVIRSDTTKAHAVCSWLEGASVRLDEVGPVRRIDQKLSRDAMRGISVLARRAGAGGVLFLLDEAERIMEQTRSVRNKSYGVIRDLLDNADNQGGMQSSIIYVAGTPELFQSQKGFPEYDALRSRLANATSFITPNLVDWRGVIVDLTRTPMPHDILMQLAGRVIDLHAVARDWNPREYFTKDIIRQMVASVESQAVVVTKPRLMASCAATLLEIVEQNRDQAVAGLLASTLKVVHASLARKAEVKQWE
jgi:bacteriophage exclusion system BrxC/D-like protein